MALMTADEEATFRERFAALPDAAREAVLYELYHLLAGRSLILRGNAGLLWPHVQRIAKLLGDAGVNVPEAY